MFCISVTLKCCPVICADCSWYCATLFNQRCSDFTTDHVFVVSVTEPFGACLPPGGGGGGGAVGGAAAAPPSPTPRSQAEHKRKLAGEIWYHGPIR